MLPYQSEQVDPIEKIFRKPNAGRGYIDAFGVDFAHGWLESVEGPCHGVWAEAGNVLSANDRHVGPPEFSARRHFLERRVRRILGRPIDYHPHSKDRVRSNRSDLQDRRWPSRS